MQLLEEQELYKALHALADRRLINSASDVTDGGLAVALSRACLPNNVGACVYLHKSLWTDSRDLFGEDSSLALISCPHENIAEIKRVIDEYGFVFPYEIGSTITTDQIDHDPDFEITLGDASPAISTYVRELRQAFTDSLESQLAKEVLA